MLPVNGTSEFIRHLNQMAEARKKIVPNRADNDSQFVKTGGETTPIANPKLAEDWMLRMKNRELRAQAVDLARQTADARRRYDWEWLTRDLYRRGYMFSSYDPNTHNVIISSDTQIKIPINLVWSQMRVIRNQVTSFRPKWEVLPTGKSEESLTNARYSGRLLDYYYDRLGLRKKLKEIVTQGLMYSVGGPWQIIYDPMADNGEGAVKIFLWDTYDFYVDMNATALEEAEFCFTAIRRPLSEIKTNPDFTFYEALDMGESRVAQSEYKQFLIQALRYQQQVTNSKNETAIQKEFWWKIRVSESNMKELAKELEENKQDSKDLKVGEILMRVIHYLDILEDPLRVQLLRRSDFPFEIYQADINPVELYGESWIKHIIPPNRALNALESSVFQFHWKMAKGRLRIDKNSGVRMINNEHGAIIEANRGAQIESIHIDPLPNSYSTQIENMRRYIEDLGGAHDISMGRIPTGVKSGVGLAELKQADATNQNDLVDNLEDFLVRVGKKVLKEIATNYDVPKVIKALGKSGDPEHFAVIGEQFSSGRKNKKMVKIGTDEFDLAKIGADNEITVKIGSWLAYTKSAQEEKLKELYDGKVIDQKTFLEHLEFNDVQNIVDRTREEAMLDKMSTTPAVGGGGVSDQEIAAQENIMMVDENRTDVVPLPTDAHSVHLAIHQEYANNDIVSKHMEKHEQMMRSPQPLPKPQNNMGAPGGIPGGMPGGMPGLPGGPMAQMGGVPGGIPSAPGGQGAPPMGLPAPGLAGANPNMPPPEAILSLLGGGGGLPNA